MTIRLFILILLSFPVFVFNSCEEDDIPSTGPFVCEPVLVSDEALDTLIIDPYSMAGVQIDSDCMKIWVLYGGGCGTVNFSMAASEYWITAFPRQKDLKLGFQDQDPCEALQNDTVRFDLRAIRDPGHNSIVINLDGWSAPLVYDY